MMKLVNKFKNSKIQILFEFKPSKGLKRKEILSAFKNNKPNYV